MTASDRARLLREYADALDAGRIHGRSSTHLMREAADTLDEAEKALREIMDELGVPGDGYPQPVANAYEIARAALARIGEK